MIVVQNCNVNIVEEKCKILRKGKVNIVVYYSFFLCVVFGDEIVVEEFIVEFDDIFVKIIFFNVRCVYYSYLIMKVSLKFKEILKGIL